MSTVGKCILKEGIGCIFRYLRHHHVEVNLALSCVVLKDRTRESESVSRSVFSDSVTPRTVARQPPLCTEFSRQEYWSGLPFTSPGCLPNPGIKPGSPALQADSLPAEPPKLGSICRSSRERVCLNRKKVFLKKNQFQAKINKGLM